MAGREEALRWALRQFDLSSTQKLVLICLADLTCDATGRCDPSLSQIAAHTRLSRRAVCGSLASMEAMGLVTRNQEPGRDMGHHRTVYVLETSLTLDAEGVVGHVFPDCGGSARDAPPSERRAPPSERAAPPSERAALPPAPSHCQETEKAETTSKAPRKTKKQAEAVASECEAILAGVLGDDLAGQFVAHRIAMRKPMTANAARIMEKRLRGFARPKVAAENSIVNGWTGVFDPALDQRKGGSGSKRDMWPGSSSKRHMWRGLGE